MNSYLFLYVPVTLAVFAVIEACRTDDPKKVLLASLRNLGWMTAVLLVGGAIVYFINRYA